MLGRGRKKTSSSYLRNGGFKIHHFDSKNIQNIRQLTTRSNFMKREVFNHQKQPREISFSPPNFDYLLSDFDSDKQAPLKEASPQLQRKEHVNQNYGQSNLNYNIKNMIQKGLVSSSSGCEREEGGGKQKNGGIQNGIKQTQFERTVRSIIDNAKKMRFMKKPEEEGSDAVLPVERKKRRIKGGMKRERVNVARQIEKKELNSIGEHPYFGKRMKEEISEQVVFGQRMTRSSGRIIKFQQPIEEQQEYQPDVIIKPLKVQHNTRRRTKKAQKKSFSKEKKEEKSPNTKKKIKKDQEESQEEQPYIQDSPFTSKEEIVDEPFAFCKTQIQQNLIKNLPSRNPSTTHNHNFIQSEHISLSQQLKDGSLYFASELITFNKNSGNLQVNCSNKHFQFIEQTLRTSKNCRQIPQQHSSHVKRIKLRRNFQYQNKKILVLDLDQTLVHSQALNQQADKQIFPLHFQFDKTVRHFTIRNHAKQFIKNMSKMFYIVVFTSAVQGYADSIIEHLDPEQKYIQHRLYRCNCYLHGIAYPYIKDLRILNKDLSQVILVDNALYTYWFNIDNGVPIASFMGEQDDQLVRLESYLKLLENVDDIRKVNRRVFRMHLYKEFQTPAQVLENFTTLLNEEIEKTEQPSPVMIAQNPPQASQIEIIEIEQ